MFDKIADILGELNCVMLLAVALGIVAVVFIIGLILSVGGDLSKFKKVVATVKKNPTLTACNATAKELPLRVRKQYKKFKQTNCKPDDAITPDAAVYSPYKESVAAHFPGAVMAAGILCILFSFFAGLYVKDAENYMIATLLVTVGVMIFRLLAGIISSSIVRGGIKAYNTYMDILGKAVSGSGESAETIEQSKSDEIPFVRADENIVTEQPKPYGDTFDAPTHISVELADETTAEIHTAAEPIPQTVVVEPSQESEDAMRARARAEAMAQARAEQAQREAAAQAAAQAQAAQAAAQQAQAQAAQAQAQAAQTQAQPASGSSADDVIARIQKITQEGAPLATMKEVALLLQRERAKPENKTPERQRKLNEALAALLKAMSGATRK